MFDVRWRWLMSKYNAVNGIWRDLAPLQSHMAFLSKDVSTSAKDRSKFSGLQRKLQSWMVVAELGLLRDALRELSRFSLQLQHQDTTVLTVGDHLETLLRALTAMKEVCCLQHCSNITVILLTFSPVLISILVTPYSIFVFVSSVAFPLRPSCDSRYFLLC